MITSHFGIFSAPVKISEINLILTEMSAQQSSCNVFYLQIISEVYSLFQYIYVPL